jgi:hypothetical protein
MVLGDLLGWLWKRKTGGGRGARCELATREPRYQRNILTISCGELKEDPKNEKARTFLHLFSLLLSMSFSFTSTPFDRKRER